MRSAWIGMASSRKAFVDTNVLLYAYDPSEAAKQPIARDLLASLWDQHGGVLSTQVLQEFYNAATRKLPLPLSRDEAREVVDLYRAWPVVTIDPALILAATRVEEAQQISFWDALIVEAARVAGAESLVTEDLQHGQVIDGVEVLNPFLS